MSPDVNLALPPAEEVLESARARGRFTVGGRQLDGPTEAFRLKQLGSRGLPRYPDAGVISTVKIPAPPLLRERDSELTHARILASAYRGAVAAFYRLTDSRFMLRGNPAHHKSYAMVGAFARLLLRDQLAPAAWVLFSMEAWRFMRLGNGPPKVPWVFSPKRFEEQQDWFLDETNRWVGGQEKYAPKHLALVVRWQRMWRELLCKRPATTLRLREIVDEHFPDETYEHAVEAARGESRRMQNDVDQRIAAGEIVWTA